MIDEQLDPDRRLALSYVRAPARAPLAALWSLDAALGHAITGAREPMLARIKLAWWRESLDRLDRSPPPAEPVLAAVAAHLLPAGISGAELARMEEGWAVLAEPEPLTPVGLAAHAADRGAALFRLSATLLGRPAGRSVEQAGEAWALADLARRSADPIESQAAMAMAAERLQPSLSWPVKLRPLGMLAALAGRDIERGGEWFEPQGSPARMMRMMRHRLSGR